MKLYFTNCSKQEKKLIESHIVYDIYDELVAFFESNMIFPHFIKIVKDSDIVRVYFNHVNECFIITEINDDELEELKDILTDIKTDLT